MKRRGFLARLLAASGIPLFRFPVDPVDTCCGPTAPDYWDIQIGDHPPTIVENCTFHNCSIETAGEPLEAGVAVYRDSDGRMRSFGSDPDCDVSQMVYERGLEQ